MVYHAQHHSPPPGHTTEKKSELEAKQGVEKPRDMLMVFIVGTLAAAIVLWVIWAMFYSPG